jgi:hypothetical protein
VPDPGKVAAELAAIRDREQAATPGPWWFDEDDEVWRLHGVRARIPAWQVPGSGALIPEQIVNAQILKAPKSGTPYAEYWPGEADAAFIVAARSDVPRLVAAVEAALKPHQPVPDVRLVPCAEHARWRGALVGLPEDGDEFETENLRVRRACPACQVFDEPYCRACVNDERSYLDWPCPAYAAITRALTGGDSK